ncbi:MAG: triple tyrosine motif-containing protein, partial [Bacteroidota bacterium]
RPENLTINENPPPIVLTSFSTLHKPRRFEKEISEVTEIDISYRENVFTFEFAALDFTNPAKNQYAYMLEGFDEEWTYYGTRRLFTYTNLDPATYVMRVKGSNSDGVWNEVGASITLTVTPPFWLASWFKISVALTILGMVIFLYNWRVDKLLEIERTRIRIARDLHDELGSNLSGIALASRMVQESANLTDAQRRRLLEISDNATQTADTMREIVWFINPEHDQPGDLVLKMKEITLSMLNGVEVSFKGQDDVFGDSMDIESRRHIFLIYKEILNNIVKHAQCSNVEIRLERQGGRFRMTVSDNGVGFNLQQRCAGNGLKNLQTRAAGIGAKLDIASSPGQGTRITLETKTT